MSGRRLVLVSRGNASITVRRRRKRINQGMMSSWILRPFAGTTTRKNSPYERSATCKERKKNISINNSRLRCCATIVRHLRTGYRCITLPPSHPTPLNSLIFLCDFLLSRDWCAKIDADELHFERLTTSFSICGARRRTSIEIFALANSSIYLHWPPRWHLFFRIYSRGVNLSVCSIFMTLIVYSVHRDAELHSLYPCLYFKLFISLL